MGTRLIVLVAALLCLQPPANAAPVACGGHGDRASMVVSTAWLAEHLHDSNLVILAVGQKPEYDRGHIPGSRFIDFASIRTGGRSPAELNTELPPMSELAATFGGFGISNDSRVVLYMLTDSLSPMARIYLTLDAMGLGARASILDGNFGVWTSEKRPVSTEVPAVKPGKIEPCPQDDVIAGLDYVKSHLRAQGVAIIDSRLPQFYTGQQAGQRNRFGHIPGAGNLPFSSLVEESGKFKPVPVLQGLFRDAGAKPGDRVVSYCHVGQQASAVYFAARYLGFDARMYDGSMDEWSRHDDLPVEK